MNKYDYVNSCSRAYMRGAYTLNHLLSDSLIMDYLAHYTAQELLHELISRKDIAVNAFGIKDIIYAAGGSITEVEAVEILAILKERAKSDWSAAAEAVEIWKDRKNSNLKS